MASTQSYVSLGVLQHTGYVLVALTTAFAILRAGIHIWRKNNFETHDFLFYAAYMLYVAVCGLYLYMAPRLFAFNDVMAGKSEPWPTIRRDVIVMFNGIFINVFIFWTCLWCAKLSLLLLYRKLMTGLPFVYMRVWWAVLAFCVLVSITSSEIILDSLSDTRVNSLGSDASSLASSLVPTSTGFSRQEIVAHNTK